MLVGTLLYGARYSPLEYLCMMMIGAGVAIFAGEQQSPHAVMQASSYFVGMVPWL